MGKEYILWYSRRNEAYCEDTGNPLPCGEGIKGQAVCREEVVRYR